MRSIGIGGFILLVLCSVGCGRSSQSVTPIKQPELKAILSKAADTGNIDDLTEVISTEIEKIEAKDSAKGKELFADFESLRKARSPAQIKEQAKKMTDKL